MVFFVFFVECCKIMKNLCKNWNHKLKYWTLICITVITCSLYIFVLPNNYYKFEETRNLSYLIFTNGCKIPYFDPFDESIKKQVSARTIINCIGFHAPLVELHNLTTLRLNHTTINEFYDSRKIKCSYTAIYRGSGLSDDTFHYNNTWIEIHDQVEIDTEFVKVKCDEKSKTVYQEFFSIIVPKKRIERKCKKRELISAKTFPEIKERLSILIVGIDSISHLNMLRHGQKTHQFLMDTMNAVQLKGHTKVADNTFVNMVPLLTGKYVQDLPWNESMKDEPFDDYPFIWKNFSQMGYRTLFAEDAPTITTFNYHKKGFFKQPTDYYIRPIMLAIEESTLRSRSKYHCIRSQLETEFVLNWVSDFAITFRNDLYFAYTFLSRLTHDDSSVLATGDEVYYNFLKKLHKGNYLDNTFLIFMSDHGARFGNHRQSYIGKVEERLPMFYLVLPQWFQDKYISIMNTLKRNSLKLTTPFDIYATLKDFLRFKGACKSVSNLKSISLLCDIPDSRTCEDATILPHWCACQEHKLISANEPSVKMAAIFLIQEINTLLSDKKLVCETLSLEKIQEARMGVSNEKLLRYNDDGGNLNTLDERLFTFNKNKMNAMRDYLLTVITLPGEAVFEATVRFVEDKNTFQLMGDISRLNRYGSQSDCVDIASLKKFCFCK